MAVLFLSPSEHVEGTTKHQLEQEVFSWEVDISSTFVITSSLVHFSITDSKVSVLSPVHRVL